MWRDEDAHAAILLGPRASATSESHPSMFAIVNCTSLCYVASGTDLFWRRASADLLGILSLASTSTRCELGRTDAAYRSLPCRPLLLSYYNLNLTIRHLLEMERDEGNDREEKSCPSIEVQRQEVVVGSCFGMVLSSLHLAAINAKTEYLKSVLLI